MVKRTPAKRQNAAPPRKRRPAPAITPAEAILEDAAVLSRGLVLGALTLVVLVFWSPAHDTYNLVKLGLLLVAASSVAAHLAWASVRAGAIVRLSHPALLFAGGVLVAMAVATARNDLRALSLMGEYSRNGGLLAFTAGLVLLAAVAWFFAATTVDRLLWMVVGVGAVVVAYGLLQFAGIEPFDVPAGDSIFSTLGQPNFVAGFIGIVAPAFLWAALRRSAPLWARGAGGAALGAAAVVAIATDSFQALPAALAGCSLVVVVQALGRWSARRVVVGCLGLALISVALAFAYRGPLERQIRSGLDERVLMWKAGFEMVADDPVLGSGPAGYAARFSAERPAVHARRFGPFQLVDAPHNVPLWHFVSGGIIQGGLYLAFVASIGWSLVSGLRQLTGEHRVLLAGVGGAWVAYQVQSLVSIDTVPFIALHFVLAGGVLAASGALRRAVVPLPALRGSRRGDRRPLGVALQISSLVAVLLSMVFTARILVADQAVATGIGTRQSDVARSISDLERATRLAGWNGMYWAELAASYQVVGDQERALIAGMTAARRAPSAAGYALSVAQLFEPLGRTQEAEQWYEIGIENAPNVPSVAGAYARFLSSVGRYEEALGYARLAVEGAPDRLEYRVMLATAADETGYADEAEGAWRYALAVQPRNPPIAHELARFLLRQDRPVEAVEPARAAVADDALNAAYQRTLAEALAGMGDAEGAIEAWERLLEIEPGNEEALRALGRG